ncbi:EscU/YscU/HrcU family type III secretion system export apparatus switch protein [Desulfoferrobacter suflitae]|uniref:EscU/YscU/HrcU family type III secretion system export apparatus switch protein n=1 Tax=Desulfoferrobacter suflitae TaxID=2865782 RepID=UPI002164B357|nr:EscU/YscU/HrcU family type III secretion system export apparatus switch protein [Desulfoferrobacter suflitae]MCK8602370.1 EscU/YscU/HrcU family type III secretion system export apparatus switch protein [Desulfoferrobacter suflitae]
MHGQRKKAVALKYQHGQDNAPKVVAKGGGIVAEKIIELARQHNVHITRDQHLVEVLATLEVYREIPVELYKAVAQILIFVYKMAQKKE